MVIDVKNRILEEGILDGFKSKTGLGLAAIAGGAATHTISKDMVKTGAKGLGDYAGTKFGEAKTSFNEAKKDFNASKSNESTPTPQESGTSEHHQDYQDMV